jgi:hypothetical protein
MSTLQIQDVMDGDLDDFIASYLRTSVDGRTGAALTGPAGGDDDL